MKITPRARTMWETPSYSLIILLMCFLKVGEIRAQCEKPYMENMVLTNDSSQPTFTKGEILTFKCALGYQPKGSGSRSITCDGNQWTNLELQCIKKSCGTPGEITNGRYLTPDGIAFGATATAKCNDGYVLFGPQTRNCLDNGWDGRVAECEAVNCSPPPEIQNGRYEPLKEQYKFGEAVTYSCNGDNILDGNEALICSETGTFQPSPPRCLVVKCDAPVISNAERVEGKSPPYKYREFVRYQCNKGYKMKGSGELTCDVKGWSPSFPVCIADSTPSPSPGSKDDNKDDHHGHNHLWIGLGVFGLCLLGGSAVGGVYYKKKGASWRQVPTRKEEQGKEAA